MDCGEWTPDLFFFLLSQRGGGGGEESVTGGIKRRPREGDEGEGFEKKNTWKRTNIDDLPTSFHELLSLIWEELT